jgi:hypothetical protein
MRAQRQISQSIPRTNASLVRMNEKIVVVRAARRRTLRGLNFFSRAFQSTIPNHHTLIKTRGIHFLQLEKQQLAMLPTILQSTRRRILH